MHRNAVRLLQLVNDLLDFARIAAGGVALLEIEPSHNTPPPLELMPVTEAPKALAAEPGPIAIPELPLDTS